MSDIVYIVVSVILLISAAVMIGYQGNKIKDLTHKINLLEQEKKLNGF